MNSVLMIVIVFYFEKLRLTDNTSVVMRFSIYSGVDLRL